MAQTIVSQIGQSNFLDEIIWYSLNDYVISMYWLTQNVTNKDRMNMKLRKKNQIYYLSHFFCLLSSPNDDKRNQPSNWCKNTIMDTMIAHVASVIFVPLSVVLTFTVSFHMNEEYQRIQDVLDVLIFIIYGHSVDSRHINGIRRYIEIDNIRYNVSAQQTTHRSLTAVV